MGERIIVRQNSRFEIEILTHDAGAHEFKAVDDVRQLTPYGMLLAGLGSCTAVVLHTYAQHHGVALDAVELRLEYDRVFEEDCEHCEGIQGYEERIEEEIVLTGDLTPAEQKRLYMVSRHCPIHKMLAGGIEVRSALAQDQ
jgi:putative redox protein